MKTALRALILLLCLGLLAPIGLRADEEDDQPPKPPEEAAPPENPPEEEPTDPAAGDEEGEDPAAPNEEESPTDRPTEMPAIPEKDCPSAMVYVPAGEAIIGTDARTMVKLLQGRPQRVKEHFLHETPRHKVDIEEFFLDMYEVTQAQYRVFLEDSARVSYDSTTGSLANLDEVVGTLLKWAQEKWGKEDVNWRQLYKANKQILWEKMPDVIVKDAAGNVDEKATEEAFRRAPLARGMELVFYDRPPPSDWPDMNPKPAFMNHPVRWVSYNDAEAFAEWAGKYIPSEQEWEYGARSPLGWVYPWGNQWFEDASHANWGGKKKDVSFRPVTVRVDGMPDGVSWCGAHQMLGNVSEWTSSWFEAYPGSERQHNFMGTYAKVIRGGGLMDLETLVLRLAARNFTAQAPKAPPVPENKFEYVGFRCAWSPDPARALLGPVLRRVTRDRMIKQSVIALERRAGAVATQFAEPGSEGRNFVSVRGRSTSLFVAPMKSIRPLDAEKPKIKTAKDIQKESTKTEDPYPLAIFHTDVPLVDVYVRVPPTKEELEERRRERERGRGRKRGPQEPKTKKGVCGAGTYILAYWHKKLCVVQPSLEFVCFLTKSPDAKALTFNSKLAMEDIPDAQIDVIADADLVQLLFTLPLGGKKTPKVTVAVMATLSLETGVLSGAGTWRITGIDYEKPEPPPTDDEEDDKKTGR